MLNERFLDKLCVLAEKMSEGKALTMEEQNLYDDIQEDAEAYRAFCLYTAFMDVPVMYMDAKRQNVERLSRERADISRYITGNQRMESGNEADNIKKNHYSIKLKELSCEKTCEKILK